MLMELFLIFFSAAIVNNFVLTKFLGICPFLGVSKKTDSAFGMGIAVTFVMLIANFATYFIQNYILTPFNIEFLQTVTFILVIATLVQLIEMYMKKHLRELFDAFGIFLPLITTNCAILGLTLLNIKYEYNLIEGIVFAIGAGAGFTLSLLIMSGIRERLELAEVPKCLDGAPIAFIVAGILALAFSGFNGMI